MPHQVSGTFASALTAWLLSGMIAPGAVAIFGVATMFASLLERPVQAFQQAAYPTHARLMNVDSDQTRRQQARLHTLQVAGTTGTALAVLLFAPVGIAILTPPEYHLAAEVVGIFILAYLLRGLFTVLIPPLLFFGGGFAISATTISSIVTVVVLAISLIPFWGIYGAACAVAGGAVVKLLLGAILIGRLYRLPWEIGKILRVLMCGGVLATADLLLCPPLSLPWSVALKAGVFAAFVPLLWLFGAVSTRELLRGKERVTAKWRASTGR